LVTVPREAVKVTAMFGTTLPLASLRTAVMKVELLQPSDDEVAVRVALVGEPTVEVAVAVGTIVPVTVGVAVGVEGVVVAVGVEVAVLQVTVKVTVVVPPLVTVTPLSESVPE